MTHTEPKVARYSFPCIGGLISTVKEGEYREAKIKTVTAFWDSLTNEERSRIEFTQRENKMEQCIECTFYLSSEAKEVGSEWDAAVRRWKRQEKEKSIPVMSNANLAEFLRENHEHPHAIAEALARILER